VQLTKLLPSCTLVDVSTSLASLTNVPARNELHELAPAPDYNVRRAIRFLQCAALKLSLPHWLATHDSMHHLFKVTFRGRAHGPMLPSIYMCGRYTLTIDKSSVK